MSSFDLSNCRFAFLDLETTGLSPWFGDRICEVGIVLTEGKRIRETFQTLVNPQRPLSLGAASTSGLTDAMLADAPLFAVVAPKVQAMLSDSVVVCHNAQFDLQFLDSEFRRLGSQIEIPNLIDTLRIAREHFDFASNTLTNIAAEFGIQNPEAHRALSDAITGKNVFFALMESLRPMRPLEEFIGIYNSPAWPNEGIRLPVAWNEALTSGKRLWITYVDKNGERTQRAITPLQVIGLADYIYLRAWCHLRNDERSFRLDRVLEMWPET
ncbi:MAG: exonuclease domain-containing protein [Anaerolineales bacterium]|nr:exonuclease domain-containing protein [Anaerolineales bacterium]